MKNITAIIPVRKGSQRIKNKNIKPFFGDKSLLHLRIELLLKCFDKDNIIVTSDCVEMLSVAKNYGVKVNRRPDNLASSDCQPSDFYSFLGSICASDHLLYSPVTTPCLTQETLAKMIHKYEKLDSEYDSLASATEVKEKMWLNGRTMNYEYDAEPASQDLPDICFLNFCACFIPKKLCIEYKNVVGKNPLLYKIDKVESIDIDENDEFRLAQMVYEVLANEKF